jgi:hypothetical protein
MNAKSVLSRTPPAVVVLGLVSISLVALTLLSPRTRAQAAAGAGAPNQGASAVAGPTSAGGSAGPDPGAVPVQAVTTARAAVPGQQVALRQLVIATSEHDSQLTAWRQILDAVGTPYDVLYASSDRLDARRLVRPDGVGRYNAVLLSSASLLARSTDGHYASALDGSEWAALWQYEREYAVRQVALNTAPASRPEDYCLRLRREGPTGTTPPPAVLTTAGQQVFDYLNPAAELPLDDAYAYRSTIAPGCAAQPLLTMEGDVLGVISVSDDGRERAALTFTLGAVRPIQELLGYGLLRWATRGVFLGEQQHWLNVDVDDWFNRNTHGLPGGPTDVYRLTGAEALAASRAQDELRARYPVADDFALNLAYNAGGIHADAPAQCSDANTPDSLTSYSRCLAAKFRWINHTVSHPAMATTDYERSRREIHDNLTAALAIGLQVPTEVLKTPEYSGLGVVPAPPGSTAGVVDQGLAASNRDLLRAASDVGVRYLHGNMSFAGHRPSCFNCGTPHPLQPDLFLVPDWPTSIFWEATTAEEETAWYNARYPDAAPHTYAGVIDSEAQVALRHLISGSVYSHTLHQTNLREYAPGHSLAFDWLDALLDKYSAYYRVPLRSPAWPDLAAYVEARTRHFAALSSGADLVWNRVANAVTGRPSADSTLFVTGLALQQGSAAATVHPVQYGSDTITRLDLAAGHPVTLIASPRR